MKKPILFSIDDDPQVLRSIRRDLRSEYKNEYRIINEDSPEKALEILEEMKRQGETVALFLSDQRMPNMSGVEFLNKAKFFYPDAKRVLLTAYSDKDAAIAAINEVQLDYYLMKPWDPPQEKMFPVLNELLDDWQANYLPEFQGIKVIGYPYSPKSHQIKDFLACNLIPYQWLDAKEDEKGVEWLALLQKSPKDLPLVVFEDGNFLVSPSIPEVAERIGMQPKALSDMYDVVIIGAGPAGLAAAVYGGSEGLKTLLVEKHAPGGQAGTSSRIENYLGFPKGLSGAELSRRALAQATRFGVEFLSPKEVSRIEIEGPYKKIHLDDGSLILSRAVVIASGVEYRKLQAEGSEQLGGAGVYYGAAMTEAQVCRDKIVYIVGGGNSAGQGAVYLSQFASEVHILIRKPDLSSGMSSYLIDQIGQIPNIQVHGRRQICQVIGEENLRTLKIENLEDGQVEEFPADAVFVFIGAKPATDWLEKFLLRDPQGYLLTGRDLVRQSEMAKSWKLSREPFLLETNIPGIFAAGDVRSGAINRVASAVGEGAMAIKFVHQYLAEN
ncbi:MAG: FAD-dependent oxidoreductase [Lewinellaceae bacterium]|nr:FAD-dependent oxidoreductase [Lewinellaceae bacterium]